MGFAAGRVSVLRGRHRGTRGKASHQRAPHGTTPFVGRSGTDVSGTQDSVTSRWRCLSREGAWGALRGLKRHCRHLGSGRFTRFITSVFKDLSQLTEDHFLPRPEHSCAQRGLLYPRQQHPTAVAGAGTWQSPGATGATAQDPSEATSPSPTSSSVLGRLLRGEARLRRSCPLELPC